MKMTTVHIPSQMTPETVRVLKQLIGALYNHTLKDDDWFHFLFQQDAMIIRISFDECVKNVRAFLHSKNTGFEEYEYPTSEHGKYNEDPNVIRHLDLLLQIFHLNSVAAITLRDDDWDLYLDRLIHTAFNSRGFGYLQEGKKLERMAAFRLRLGGGD